MTTFAICNPGAMGSALGAALRRNGQRVLWTPEGRSEATADRAQADDLSPTPSFAELCAQSQVLVSIVPPHAATALAEAALANGFRGLYLDANAIAPESAEAIAQKVEAEGCTYVDGAVVGPPPRSEESGSRLYLSAAGARDLAASFRTKFLSVEVLDGPRTSASALKMCYGGYTKCHAALLAALHALALNHDVLEPLQAEFARSIPRLEGFTGRSMPALMRKAWRFSGEMREVADTLDSAGLPGEIHRGAAEVYERLGPWKDQEVPADVLDLLRALHEADHDETGSL